MGEMRNVCEDLDVRALKGYPIHCYEDNIKEVLEKHNLLFLTEFIYIRLNLIIIFCE